MTHNTSPEEQLKQTISEEALYAVTTNHPDAYQKIVAEIVDDTVEAVAAYLRTLQEKMPEKRVYIPNSMSDSADAVDMHNFTLDQCQSVLQTAINELEK